MNKTYLLLGSNLGNPLLKLRKCREMISKHIGLISRQSGIYYTSPWGMTDQPYFLNQVIIVETLHAAPDTLHAILDIEKKMGRVRTVKNAPRTIDIDILFFNKTVSDQNQLILPHPRIQNRRFVLVPLHELSPNLVHPVLKKTIHQLLRVCPDKLAVKKI